MPFPRSHIWRIGEREGCGIFGGASTYGETDVPPFPKGADVGFLAVRGAAPKGPKRGGDLRIRSDLQTGGL